MLSTVRFIQLIPTGISALKRGFRQTSLGRGSWRRQTSLMRREWPLTVPAPPDGRSGSPGLSLPVDYSVGHSRHARVTGLAVTQSLICVGTASGFAHIPPVSPRVTRLTTHTAPVSARQSTTVSHEQPYMNIRCLRLQSSPPRNDMTGRSRTRLRPFRHRPHRCNA